MSDHDWPGHDGHDGHDDELQQHGLEQHDLDAGAEHALGEPHDDAWQLHDDDQPGDDQPAEVHHHDPAGDDHAGDDHEPHPADDLTGAEHTGHTGPDDDGHEPLGHEAAAADVFPPMLEVGPLPEPVDGFPWIDTGSLGLAHAGIVDQDMLDRMPAQDPSELAAYAAEDLPPGADPWEHLAGSQDPATAALAEFYRPGDTDA